MPGARGAPRAGAAMLAVVGLSSALGCASYSDALSRGQRYYEDNQYERALALWRDLDRRQADFEPRERARYAYFRGMTDYRLGYRDDARHWLAIARATEDERPGGLGSVWLARLDGALADLGREPSRSGAESTDLVQTIEAPPGAGPTVDAPGSGLDSSRPGGTDLGPATTGDGSRGPAAAPSVEVPSAGKAGSETFEGDAGTSPVP